jgi:4-amino-4-deoxy-L-arabinose transferase-like glycosyltransferase
VKWREISWIILLIVVAAVPRLLHLDADPRQDFQATYLADEGLYAHNARLHALFGDWTMDDHNVALYTASLHTVSVRLSYALFGTGLWQTRLPAAIAGILTCLVLYAFLRRETTWSIAVAATLLLTLSGFVVSHNRVAYTESIQTLLVTVGFFAALRSRAAAPWAAVSAMALIAAMLAKPSSLGCVVAVVLLVGFQLLRDTEHRPQWLRATGVFCVTGLACLAVLAFALVVPNWEGFTAEVRQLGRTATGGDPPFSLLKRFLLYGFRNEPDSVRILGGWLTRDALLVLGVGLLGFARLVGLYRRPMRPLEMGCWMWVILTLMSIATHPALAPDRYYVLIMPALAILLATAAFHREDHRLGSTPPWRLLLAWLAALLVPGVLIRGFTLPLLRTATNSVTFGAEPGLSTYTLAAILWVVSAIIATIMIARRRAWLGWLVRRHWAIALTALAIFVGGVSVAADVGKPEFKVREASRAIGRLAAELPPDRRAIVGVTSITMALETELFAFIIRDWPRAHVFMNLDGISRFRPGLAVFTTLNGIDIGGQEGFEVPASKRVVVFDYYKRPGDTEGLRTTVHVLP